MPAQRVHRRYRRHLTDAGFGGRMIMIDLRVRRHFCDSARCVRGTFAKQRAGLTVRYGRARRDRASNRSGTGRAGRCPPRGCPTHSGQPTTLLNVVMVMLRPGRHCTCLALMISPPAGADVTGPCKRGQGTGAAQVEQGRGGGVVGAAASVIEDHDGPGGLVEPGRLVGEVTQYSSRRGRGRLRRGRRAALSATAAGRRHGGPGRSGASPR
ncbi:hypothetical protein [Actinacidiphila glaucinigra]|uniref:hypothetical protein n=1 Tax=Actinacidiphila glaucinigra TaxID=235986 RepID=UPI0035DF22BC